MSSATSTRLSIAAHRDFPGSLLDGAMPNGDSGLLVTSGMSDFSGALMAAERDNSEVLLAFTHRGRPDLIRALTGPGLSAAEIARIECLYDVDAGGESVVPVAEVAERKVLQ